MTTGNDQANSGELWLTSASPGFKQYSMDVPFQMIDRDERLVESERQHFAIGHSDKQRADQSRTACDGDGIDLRELNISALDGLAHNRNNLPEMFTGSKFGNHTAVFAMDLNLRSNDARENPPPGCNHSGGRLVAGRFDPKN